MDRVQKTVSEPPRHRAPGNGGWDGNRGEVDASFENFQVPVLAFPWVWGVMLPQVGGEGALCACSRSTPYNPHATLAEMWVKGQTYPQVVRERQVRLGG